MHFICRSFLGHTESNSWSQYWENEPDDTVRATQKGHLFALANIVSDQNIPASDLGHQLIDDINEQYFSTPFTSISSDLQRTLDIVTQKPQYELVDISLTIAIIDRQSNLYIAMYNSGYGLLVRESKISQIIAGQTSKITVISGQIRHQDLLFLCTDSFYQNATLANIKKYLSEPSIQEMEESVLSDLYTYPNQSTIASLLIGIYQDVETVSSPTILPPDNIPSPAEPEPEPPPSIYVSRLDSHQVIRRRQLNIIFSVIILLALGFSIYFGSRRNQQIKTESEFQAVKVQYHSKLDNAKAIKNINLQESQKLSQEAKDLALKLQALKIHPDEVIKFISDADKILSTTGSADSYQPVDFYDTTLVNKSANYSIILTVETNLFLVDIENGFIDKIDSSTKSQQKVIKNDLLKNIKSIAQNNGILYLLINQEVYSLQGSSLKSVINLKDEIENYESGQIRMWNGSLYLLAKTTDSEPNIWKFTPSGTSFGSATAWLKDSSQLPSNTSSFAINGQVWVITTDGQVTPYNRGAPEKFTSEMVSTLKNAANLETNLDSEIIAFTEGDNLVYVYGKDGSVASSYNYQPLHISSIALDSQSERIFVLCTDHKIYQIKL